MLSAEDLPQRPKPLLELGDPFLGTGTLQSGFELPTGAVWQPSLLVFGTFRSALQNFDDGDISRFEWANRLDLFANLQLSGTERLVIGMRPVDEDGQFSGYQFHPESGASEYFNAELQTFFFEGDFGEIFPNLDPGDSRSFDLGFSVGRQPLSYQEGMLIDDDMQALGLTRNTLLPQSGSDWQLTLLWSWDEINRGNNRKDQGSDLFALLFAGDFPHRSINADLVYVDSDQSNGDGLYLGLASVQRLGHFNTALRVLGSKALDDESSWVGDGTLLFGEVSWTPAWSHDLVYVNGFWGIDDFTSAARGPDRGGPLGRVGILFAAVGLGQYQSPLDNRPKDAFGGAIGYQHFMDHTRRQLTIELGTRFNDNSQPGNELAIGARFQQALGRRFVLQLDGFVGDNDHGDFIWGARTEMRVRF